MLLIAFPWNKQKETGLKAYFGYLYTVLRRPVFCMCYHLRPSKKSIQIAVSITFGKIVAPSSHVSRILTVLGLNFLVHQMVHFGVVVITILQRVAEIFLDFNAVEV